MSGNVAINPATGEVVVLSPEGAWEPARRARNPQSGAELFFDGQQWRDMPARPEPASTMGRSIGVGVRDMIVGLPALPGMLYDVAGAGINAATGALEPMGGPSLPRVRSAAENLEGIADTVGLPRPQNASERTMSAVNRSVAGNLPAIGAGLAMQGAGQAPAVAQTLAGNISSQIGGAVGAGYVGHQAQEHGAGPWATMGAALRDVEARRNAVRLGELLLRQDGSNAAARGQTVRTALGTADDAMGQRVGLAFDVARDRNTGRYATAPVMEAARQATRIFDPRQGGGGIPGELQAVLDDLGRMPNVTLTQAQNIRSRLMEMAGRASVAGDNRLASAAGTIARELEGAVADPRWVQAMALRLQQGHAMGRDALGTNATGRIMAADRFGSPTMPAEAVPGTALRSPQAVRQVMEALHRSLDDARAARLPTEALTEQVRAARTALRGQFMDNMLRAATGTSADVMDAAGNATRALSATQFRRFWDANRAMAREIFEPGHLRALDRLAADFAETATMARTAAATGSPTAQTSPSRT